MSNVRRLITTALLVVSGALLNWSAAAAKAEQWPAEAPILSRMIESGVNGIEPADPERSPDESIPEIDRLDDKGFSKLHAAAIAGNVETARELLERGADPNVRQGTYRGTPLQYAAAQGHVAVVRLLLKHDADVDATDTRGRTPLMWARREGQTEVVRQLVKAGADPKEPRQPAGSRPQNVPEAPPAPDVAGRHVGTDDATGTSEEPSVCQVRGRIVSTEYQKMDGGIERAIVAAWKLPGNHRVALENFSDEYVELELPPGRYRLDFSAVGTRGATFQGTSREITVQKGERRLDVGTVDLAVSRTTALFDQPAPELDGITAWWNTEPVRLADLRGKVVVLDFFSYTCSICHAHKPDLAKLLDEYGERGLAILALHDDSLKSLPELTEQMSPILHRVFKGKVPKLPMALDGSGEQGVFRTYGIGAVPAVLLIDQEGRVVQRFHHAGKPELEEQIRGLLNRDE